MRTRMQFRPAACAALAAAMVALPAGPVRAQGFAIPIPASVVVAPLLLLTSVAILLSRSDATRVRELEQRGDWNALLALAGEHLAQQPDDPVWLEVRGRALQRLGRCEQAIPDLTRAFDAQLAARRFNTAPVYDLALALGLCQMALGDAAAAQVSFERAMPLSPTRWEADYYRGLARLQQGDAAGALAHAAALRPRQPAMADALEARIRAESRPPAAAAPVAAVPLQGDRLVIGARVLQLPGAGWWEGPAGERVQLGRYRRQHPLNDMQARVGVARAWQSGPAGLSRVVVFSANPAPTDIQFWQMDDPCAVDALHVERFGRPADQPECLSLRRVSVAGLEPSADLGPALLAARQAGVPLPDSALEIRYARRVPGGLVGATVLLAGDAGGNEALALQWGFILAERLRPLAGAPAAADVRLPELP